MNEATTSVAFTRPVAQKLAELLEEKRYDISWAEVIRSCLDSDMPAVAIETKVAAVKQLKEWLEPYGHP